MFDLEEPKSYEPSHPWSALAYVVGATWGYNFTGEIKLLVNQDGLQNRIVDSDCKLKFREKVTPWLKQKACIAGKLTGQVELHVAEGKLKKARLHIKQ